jgi:hypothetical protein
MATPKRYSRGVTNVGAGSVLADLPTMAPNKVHLFFDDFDHFSKNVTANLANWIHFTEGAGNTVLMKAADGGQVELYADTDTESVYISQPVGCVTYEAGKQLWWGVRWWTIEHVDTSIGFGLTTALTDDAIPVDGVYVVMADSVSTMIPSIMNTNVVNALGGSLHTQEASTWYLMECYFDGIETFTFYIDGIEKGTLATDAFPTAALAPWIWVLAGQSHADNKLVVDYFYFAKER